MQSFRDPDYVERYEDVVFDLETALNTTVGNNAHNGKQRIIAGWLSPECNCMFHG